MILNIETPRLILRPLKISDAEAMFAMDNNPNVHQYLWQNPTKDISETIQIIEFVQKQYVDNGIGRFATVLKETGEFVGWTGLKFVTDYVENGNTNFYDYGYRLNEKFWNKGIATEASVAWLNYAFQTMRIDELNAYTHAQNGASNQVLNKVGFNFKEEYPDKEGVIWKWWQLLQSDYKNKI